MRDLAIRPSIPAMSEAAIGKVRVMESIAMGLPQVPIPTEHVIHGGMYARTVRLPAGCMITGVLIKVATMLIVCGDAVVYVGDEIPLRLVGYNVLPASAGRKQAFVAVTEVTLTMVFPTGAKTVEEAERAFTDEGDLLASHRDNFNSVTITGE